MEDADTGLAMEVPDTPDRLATTSAVRGQIGGKEGTTPVIELFRDFGTRDKECQEQLGNRRKLATENGHNGRLFVHPSRISSNINGSEHPRTSFATSSSGKSLGSQQQQKSHNRNFQTHLPGISGNIDGCEHPRNSITIPLSGSSHASQQQQQQQQNGHIRRLHIRPPKKSSIIDEECPKNSIAGTSSGDSEQQKNGDNRGFYIHPPRVSSTIGERVRPHNSIVVSSIGNSHASKNAHLPRPQVVDGDTKDEARLGKRAQYRDKGKSIVTKVPAKSSPCVKDDVLLEPNESILNSHACEMAFASGLSTDIRDPNSSSTAFGKSLKGKEKANECTYKGSGSVFDHGNQVAIVSDSRHKNGKQISLPSPSVASPGMRKRLVRNGCISPHNIARRARHLAESSSTSSVNVEQNNVTNGINSTNCANSEDLDVSGFVSASDHISGPAYMIKRQKTLEATSRNYANSSRTVPQDSEVVCLGSSVASKNSQSSSSQTHHSQSLTNCVIEIDDLSPVMRHRNPQDTDCMSDDVFNDVHARTIQIEADEILARELQEQLYHEDLVIGGSEVDEHLAWALQQEDGTRASLNGRSQVLRPRLPSMTRGHRPHSQPFRNTSYRRGSRGRDSSSSRIAQLRNRFRGQPLRLSARRSVPDFPFDMDLDMRLNILEALEAAVGDLDERRMDNHILRIQRDFNENDYEMLLALDENNHHVGTSANHIQSLPLSTVQSENFEDCAVCLETPAIGDSIRHLPCLHKFHKDCIDPWLSGNTSCPICKSSVT